MLTREQVFEVVNRERDYQDQIVPGDGETSYGITRNQRDLDITGTLVIADAYMQRAKEAYLIKGNQGPCLQNLAKVLTVLVRGLERAAGSEKLLSEGLR